jgi:chromosome partitioning protein
VRIWAFISQKGGVGKSTLSCQLAVYAGKLELKTIILDLDPQASASVWHQQRGAGEPPPVVQVLPDKLGTVVDHIRGTGAFDLVIIDTAPHTDKGALAAISQADIIVCPTKPAMVDLAALKDTVNIIELADAKGRAIGVVNGVPVTGSGKGATKAYAKASEYIERFGIRVAASYIGDRVAFVHAMDAGKGVTENAKGSTAEKELQALWSELNETPPLAVLPTAEETKS